MHGHRIPPIHRMAALNVNTHKEVDRNTCEHVYIHKIVQETSK